jgi:hypothetical protein
MMAASSSSASKADAHRDGYRFGIIATTNAIMASAPPNIINPIGDTRLGINRYWRRCCIQAPMQIITIPISVAIIAKCWRVIMSSFGIGAVAWASLVRAALLIPASGYLERVGA